MIKLLFIGIVVVYILTLPAGIEFSRPKILYANIVVISMYTLYLHVCVVWHELKKVFGRSVWCKSKLYTPMNCDVTHG